MATLENIFGSTGPGSIIPQVNVNIKALDKLSILKRVYGQINAAAEDERRRKILIQQGVLNPDGTQKVTEGMTELSKFVAEVNNRNGLAKQDWFSVMITTPSTTASTARTVSLFCDSASFPSQNIMTADLKIYGVVTQMPYMRAYEDVTMTFIVDRNMIVKSFFDLWADLIVDDAGGGGTRDVGFLRQYAGTITVSQLSSQDANAVYTAVMLDAYPKTISLTPLNYTTADWHKLTVTFTYQKIYYMKYDAQNPEQMSPLPQDLLNAFIKPDNSSFGSKLSGLVDKYSSQVSEWRDGLMNKAGGIMTQANSYLSTAKSFAGSAIDSVKTTVGNIFSF